MVMARTYFILVVKVGVLRVHETCLMLLIDEDNNIMLEHC